MVCNDKEASKDRYRNQTIEVGSLQPNPYGLYDTHGNVSEWTCSLYDAEYHGDEKMCHSEATSGERVVRGGSWFDRPEYVRSASRSVEDGDAVKHNYLGFRLVREID